MTIQPYEESRIEVAPHPSLINPTTDSWTAVVSDVIKLATVIAPSEFVPAGLRGSAPKVTAAILHGRELGLPPMSALAGVHVISGKAGISAELMRALILQAGHELAVSESTASRCVMQGRRTGWEQWTRVAYTMEEAIKAGDAKKNPNYGSRPAEMLLARATTRLARMIFADVIHGMRSVEELEDMADGEPGEAYVAPVAEQVTVSRAPRAVESAPTPRGTRDEAGAEGGEAEKPAQAPASPPRRRSAPLTPRGQRTAPPETPEPAAKAAQPEAGTSREASADGAPRGAVRSAVMHLQRLGVSERAERLYWTGLIAGREIESTNDLDAAELRDVASRLERVKDRAALEALGAVLESEREGQSDE